MIEITADIYRRVATRLREEIATAEWFNGAIEGVMTDVEWRLVLTAIVYRRTERLPEGLRRPISDVVPVWWEFTTEGGVGAVLNDFSFAELKSYLIDYD